MFVLAVEDFLKRYQNRKLLDELNAAYDDLLDQGEPDLIQQMRPGHKALVEGEW